MKGLHRIALLLTATATPLRVATKADSARAVAVAKELRAAIARYADTAAAVRDGFRMFAPQLKTQKTFHFTKRSNGFKEAFRFDPAKPTSLLYEKDSTGRPIFGHHH